MIDLHSHTFFSDGDLCPSELVRRCEDAGYRGLLITDHCDPSNLAHVVPSLRKFCDAVSRHVGLVVRAGCELTHCPPEMIAELTATARSLGAHAVLVHGETIVEPVPPGTNLAAIEAGVDVLAHPGLISLAGAVKAAEKGVRLEISARCGHSLANGHVVAMARETGAMLSFGTDTHAPEDITPRRQAERIARGAGLREEEIRQIFLGAARLLGLEELEKIKLE